MAKLTEHFNESEFACRCCGEVKIAFGLVKAIQNIRYKLGVPVYITSGCRCAEHNKAIGGHPRSYHISGRAADWYPALDDIEAVLRIINSEKTFLFGGVGLYTKLTHTLKGNPKHGWWFHTDNRVHRGRWGCINGSYCSFEDALRIALQRRAACQTIN